MENGKSKSVEVTVQADVNDFDDMFTAVYPQLFSMALIRLRDYHEAEDAVQETAMLAYRAFATLKNREHFKTWITRILINCCNRQSRKLQKFFTHGDKDIPDSQDDILLKEDELLLCDAINKLDNKSKQIVILRYFSDYTVPEIAQTLEISQGTVKSRLSRSMKKMQKYFDEKEGLK